MNISNLLAHLILKKSCLTLQLIEQIIKKYNNEDISNNLIEDIYLNGRKNFIKRCINNLIDNALNMEKNKC